MVIFCSVATAKYFNIKNIVFSHKNCVMVVYQNRTHTMPTNVIIWLVCRNGAGICLMVNLCVSLVCSFPISSLFRIDLLTLKKGLALEKE